MESYPLRKKYTIHEQDHHCPLLKYKLTQQFPPEDHSRGRAEKSNSQRHFSQETRVDISSYNSCWWLVSLIWCDENSSLPLWSSSPRPRTPASSGKTHQTDPNWGTFCKVPHRSSSKPSRSLKTRTVRETISLEEPRITWQPHVTWGLGWGSRTETR